MLHKCRALRAVYGIVRGYATVAEKANVKEGTLVEGDTYYIQS